MQKQNKYIDISVELQGKQTDLRVPCQISLLCLTKLVGQAFIDRKQPILGNWHLQLKSSEIQLDEQELLSRYPVANGAIFEVRKRTF